MHRSRMIRIAPENQEMVNRAPESCPQAERCSTECAQACPMMVANVCRDSADKCAAMTLGCIERCPAACESVLRHL